MKSNVCKIEKGTQDLEQIFVECDKVAKYNELGHKQALQLRLLGEELVNMLPSIVSNFSGEFWIENQEDYYELCINVKVDNMDIDTRDRLIKVSKNNKNASIVGITGKIRAVFDYMAMGGDDLVVLPAGRYGFSSNMDYTQVWSLQEYRDTLDREESPEWDEFEKSIVVKIADDVTVGVKGKTVKMMIKKTFA